jgi:hypothetical protein
MPTQAHTRRHGCEASCIHHPVIRMITRRSVGTFGAAGRKVGVIAHAVGEAVGGLLPDQLSQRRLRLLRPPTLVARVVPWRRHASSPAIIPPHQSKGGATWEQSGTVIIREHKDGSREWNQSEGTAPCSVSCLAWQSCSAPNVMSEGRATHRSLKTESQASRPPSEALEPPCSGGAIREGPLSVERDQERLGARLRSTPRGRSPAGAMEPQTRASRLTTWTPVGINVCYRTSQGLGRLEDSSSCRESPRKQRGIAFVSF